MATLYSDNYNKQVGTDKTHASVGDIRGVKRVIYFECLLGVAVVAIADVIKLCVLPAGARVTGWQISLPSTGTTGIFSLGNAASADGSIAAVVGAFGTGYDAGGQAVSAKPGALGSESGLNKKFAQPVDIQLQATEATDVGTAVTFKGFIEFVIE
jgi:hypothetical protein